jgi:hypothetical protein
MRQARHISHGRRRRWLRPWQVICQCALGAWPCPTLSVSARSPRRLPVNERPEWNGPTRVLPNATFRLNPGQLSRSRGNGR